MAENEAADHPLANREPGTLNSRDTHMHVTFVHKADPSQPAHETRYDILRNTCYNLAPATMQSITGVNIWTIW